jgi:hypothetical protein
MQERIRQAGSSCIRQRIVQAAVRLHREIGFKKTTVADIARGTRDHAAGQASGELRPGSSMAMTCCLLEAMGGYLNPLRIKAATVRPTSHEMMDFCASAHAPSVDGPGRRLTSQSLGAKIVSGA